MSDTYEAIQRRGDLVIVKCNNRHAVTIDGITMAASPTVSLPLRRDDAERRLADHLTTCEHPAEAHGLVQL